MKVEGEIKIDGVLVGKILDVAYRGKHGKLPECEVVKVPPFISSQQAVETAINMTYTDEERLEQIVNGRRFGRNGG